MKLVLTICSLVIVTYSNLVDISFSPQWVLDNGVTIENDTLCITGSESVYRKAQLTVQVPSTTKNLYFVGAVLLENIGESDKSYKAPKFKVYDGSGGTLQAYNMPALIQGEWYTTGMVIKSFDKKDLSTITIEFSMQNIAGSMKVALPQLLDTPPVSEYRFPFDMPSDMSTTISINTKDKAPFINELLSVNSHFVWASSTWGSEDVLTILNSRLKLGNLRFPGGTVGNFYDWESDGFYGDEWTFLSPSRKKAYENGFRFDYSGYVENCLNSGASSSLMFNVIQDSPEKAKLRLQNRIASGIDIKWIEMGNENFFTEQAFGNVSSLDKYISHTKELASALKEVDPETKVAVNLNHHDFSDGSWNLELAKENYYDAAIIHPYVQTNSFMLNNYSAKIMLSAYRTTQQRIEEYKQHFGSKPLLFTEWGILSEGSPSNFVQALSVADMFLSIIEGGDNGVVKQAGIHMLYHSDNYNEATLYFKDGSTMKRTRLGVLYEKMSNLFFGHNLYDAKGKSAFLDEGLQAVNARAVEYGDSIKILAVNKTPQSSHLTITLDGMEYVGDFTIESFREKILGDSTGYTLTENPWNTVTGSGTITLSANAINVVTIPKNSAALTHNIVEKVHSVTVHTSSNGVRVILPSKGTVRMISLQGKELEVHQNVRRVVLGSSLAKGCYLLQWKIGQLSATRKVYID